MATPITDIESQSGRSGIARVGAWVQVERPGRILVFKTLVDIDPFFLAGVVSCRFNTQGIARELDDAVIALVEHTVDEVGKIALGGDAVLDEVGLEVRAVSCGDFHGFFLLSVPGR